MKEDSSSGFTSAYFVPSLVNFILSLLSLFIGIWAWSAMPHTRIFSAISLVAFFFLFFRALEGKSWKIITAAWLIIYLSCLILLSIDKNYLGLQTYVSYGIAIIAMLLINARKLANSSANPSLMPWLYILICSLLVHLIAPFVFYLGVRNALWAYGIVLLIGDALTAIEVFNIISIIGQVIYAVRNSLF